MNLVIYGRVPSKKNSRRVIYVGGRTIMIPGKDYEAWHKDAEKQIATQRPKKGVRPGKIAITFYPPDRVRGDLTNKAESVMDLLVDAGVIEDDNWFVVPEVTLFFGEVDRKNPRAEIKISGSAP